MILQNVTSFNSFNQSFLFYYIDIKQNNNITISYTLEIIPDLSNVSYLIIYKFDQLTQSDYLTNEINGWTLLCYHS